jgi:hypothetical protein
VAAQSGEDVAFWEMDVPPEGGWHVGDVISLRLRVTTPDDVDATLPVLPEQWGAFEVSTQSVAEPEKSDERTVTVLDAAVQLWEAGIYETPPTTVTLQRDGVDSYEIDARPLKVEIVSVLPSGEEQGALEKRDLKPQAILPKPPIWPWILAALAAVPLLYFGGRWIWQKIPRRHRILQEENKEVVADNRLPEDIAYACLDRITRMDLPGIGAFKQHYTLVTDCIRHYLYGIYGIAALDMTTTELRRVLRKQKIDAETLNLLWSLLDQADLVKFAKLEPDVTHARMVTKWGRHFVDCTKPQRQQGSEITQQVVNV